MIGCSAPVPSMVSLLRNCLRLAVLALLLSHSLAFLIPKAFHPIHSQKCAINNWGQKFRGDVRLMGLGGHTKLFMLPFSPPFQASVSGTANRPNINFIGGRRPA